MTGVGSGTGDPRNSRNPGRTSVEARMLRLRHARPRSRFLRVSGCVAAGLVGVAWLTGDLSPAGLLSERRMANLERFFGEIRPYPLQGREWDWGIAFDWLAERLQTVGLEAMATTLALSVAAIVLAGFVGLVLALPAARTWAVADPYLPRLGAERRWVTLAWRGLLLGSRVLLIFLRALPEYVWGFIFLMLIGPTAWPIVLALAIHNAGILGKLDAEVVENLPSGPAVALRGLGAGRTGIAGVAVLCEALPRFLLLLFYRWETCVREATVLGMLGIVSLGFWIVDARARQRYDDMILFVLLGAALVLLGDLVSAWVRGRVRTAR